MRREEDGGGVQGRSAALDRMTYSAGMVKRRVGPQVKRGEWSTLSGAKVNLRVLSWQLATQGLSQHLPAGAKVNLRVLSWQLAFNAGLVTARARSHVEVA